MCIYVERIVNGVFFIILLGLPLTLAIFMIESLVQDWRQPKFTLVSFTLKGLNVSDSSVGGNWDARFQIQSKDFGVGYDDIESSVSYNGEVLSRTGILAFNQHAHKLTLIEVLYSAIDASASQRDVIFSPTTVSVLTADLARGSVRFDVRVVGKMSSSVSNQQRLKVLCGVVPIIVSEDGASGNFNDGPRKGKVILHDIPTRRDGSTE